MPTRPRQTFSKRQKEQARQEKQRAKAQRKLQRKLENQVAGSPVEADATNPDDAIDASAPQDGSAPHIDTETPSAKQE